MPTSFDINYSFTLKDGKNILIPITIDENTLTIIKNNNKTEPDWGLINLQRCDGCPLDPQKHSHCPVAEILAAVIEEFKDYNSYDSVYVRVDVCERSYIKDTDLQDGLGSLLGILMTTSGCPYMAPLKPMIRFHLPFASMEETEFRMVSMYLTAQYILQQSGKEADWTLEGLKDIYTKVELVNNSVASRLRKAYEKDASINAVVLLDCFGKSVTHAINNMMDNHGKYFTYYTDQLAYLQSL